MRKIKTGFRTSGFENRNIFQALAAIRDIGYDGVELCLEHPDLQPRRLDRNAILQIRRYIKEIGLEIASVSYHGKRDTLEKKFDVTIQSIQACMEFECPFLIISSLQKQAHDQFDEFVDFMKNICKAAESKCLSIAVEPEPETVINGIAEMQLLMDQVRSDRLMINLDVGHSYLTDGDVYKTIESYGGKIIHVHITDIKGKVHEHLVPGKGDIDLKKACCILEMIRYNGFLTIDLFKISDDPEGFAAKALKGFQNCLL